VENHIKASLEQSCATMLGKKPRRSMYKN